MRLNPRLLLCYEDAPGSYRPVSSPDDHEGTQFVPVVEPPNRALMVRTRDWPVVQGIWRVVLNVTAIDPHAVEYLNGDRFDLRSANLRLIDA